MKFDMPLEEKMHPGNLACQGCGGALSMRMVLKALGDDTVAVIPACCWWSSAWSSSPVRRSYGLPCPATTAQSPASSAPGFPTFVRLWPDNRVDPS